MTDASRTGAELGNRISGIDTRRRQSVAFFFERQAVGNHIIRQRPVGIALRFEGKLLEHQWQQHIARFLETLSEFLISVKRAGCFRQ